MLDSCCLFWMNTVTTISLRNLVDYLFSSFRLWLAFWIFSVFTLSFCFGFYISLHELCFLILYLIFGSLVCTVLRFLLYGCGPWTPFQSYDVICDQSKSNVAFNCFYIFLEGNFREVIFLTQLVLLKEIMVLVYNKWMNKKTVEFGLIMKLVVICWWMRMQWTADIVLNCMGIFGNRLPWMTDVVIHLCINVGLGLGWYGFLEATHHACLEGLDFLITR